MTTKDTALNLFDLGFRPVIIEPNGKVPTDTGWPTKTYDRAELAARFENNPALNVGIVLGDVIDVECDSETAEAECAELFEDCPIDVTPSWQSRRGPPHRLFASDPRLSKIGKAVLKYKTVEIRIGGDKGAQSVLPPSITDGFERKWVNELSSECMPPPLPELVIERLLAL